MLAYIRNVTRRDEGATAVEYGLIVAAIAAIIVLVVIALGGYVKGAFKKTCNDVSKAGAGTTVTAAQGATCNS